MKCTEKEMREALLHLRKLVSFAHEQGYHEVGYNSIRVLETAVNDLIEIDYMYEGLKK